MANEKTANQTTAAKLNYVIASTPNPVKVGTAVDLTVVISNGTSDEIYVKEIQIQLPVGTIA